MCPSTSKETLRIYDCMDENGPINENLIGKVITGICSCIGLPQSIVSLEGVKTPALWDTGSTSCVISIKTLQNYFPSWIEQIMTTKNSVFAAGNKKLEVNGTINLQLSIGNIKKHCTFIVISEPLKYIIIGYDFIKPQNIIIHPHEGIIQLTRNNEKDEDIQSIHMGNNHNFKENNKNVNVNNINNIHECIDVITSQDCVINPDSTISVKVSINFKDEHKNLMKNEELVISSECMQTEISDWKNLQVFFQLVRADKTTKILVTNKKDTPWKIPAKTKIACAEFCYNAIQVDPRITINQAPMATLLHVMETEILKKQSDDHKLQPESHINLQPFLSTSSKFDEDLGIDLPLQSSNKQDEELDLTQISLGSENKEERIFVENLVKTHEDIISKSQWDVGLFNEEPAHFSIKSGVQPKFSKQPAIIDPAIRKVAEGMITELEKRGLIRECQSPWNSPLLVNRKSPREYKLGSIKTSGSVCKIPGQKRSKWDPTAGLRFVISLKHLNMSTKPCRQHGQLPKVPDQLNQLREYTVLHSLDFSGAFWQLALDESSQELTGFFFATPYSSKQYCLCRLPQGYKDSSSIFTNRAHRFIQKYNLWNSLSYIDNFLVGSTEKTAKRDLEKVFKAIQDAGLKIRLAKCHFFIRTNVTIFGFTINLKNHSIHPDLRKVESILKMTKPTTKKETRTFLGKIQYYYRMIPGLNSLLDPLFTISGQSSKFRWSEEHTIAFEKAKRRLAKGPLLYMPNPDNPRHLVVDSAQKQGIASAIFEYDQKNNLFLPLRYTSHPLRGSQLNYSQFAVEAFGLVRGVRENIDLITNTLTYIYTDCQSLTYLVRMSDYSNKASRWVEFLNGFDFQIVFLPNTNALLKMVDYLSRPQTTTKKRIQKPANINQNLFDFSGIKPCAIQKLTGTLQKNFSQDQVNMIQPDLMDIEELEDTPKLFNSDIHAANYTFDQMIHDMDNTNTLGHKLTIETVPNINTIQDKGTILNESTLENLHPVQKLIPYPKDHVSIQTGGLKIPPPSLSFQNKINPSQALTRQIIYEYLNPLSLEQLKILQEQCDFCVRKKALYNKGNTMFKIVHGLLCFQQGKQKLKIVIPEKNK